MFLRCKAVLWIVTPLFQVSGITGQCTESNEPVRPFLRVRTSMSPVDHARLGTIYRLNNSRLFRYLHHHSQSPTTICLWIHPSSFPLQSKVAYLQELLLQCTCSSAHFEFSFIHPGYFYSASSIPLPLRGAPDTARILCRNFTPKRRRQL